MNKRWFLVLSAFTMAIMPAGAKPRDAGCGPLREVASLAMTPEGARMRVPLLLNGKPVSFVVDTGAGMSSLTAAAASRLGMTARETAGTRLIDGGGGAVHRYYVADSVGLGPLTAKRIAFLQRNDTGDGGAMGPDMMLRYDVEMDFSNQKLTYFSQDHCPGRIVHWPADAVADIPLRIVARSRDYPPPAPAPAAASLSADFVNFLQSFGSPILGTDIRANVLLDGRAFTANIDTGLEISTINSEAAAAYFAAQMETPSPATQGDVRPSVQAPVGVEAVTVTEFRRQHRFHTLALGDVTITNPLFALKPALPDSRRVDAGAPPDISIGMNVLRKLHLYFAFGEKQLYVSAAQDGARKEAGHD